MRWASFGLACLAVVAVAASMRMPPAAQGTKFDVGLLANQSPELQVTPAGTILRATDLEPGAPGSGPSRHIRVRNITPAPLSLRVGADAAGYEVDDVLHISIRARGRELFSGPLARLRAPGSRPLRLASGQGARLAVRAWVPSGLQAGFMGRAPDVTLRLATTSARRP